MIGVTSTVAALDSKQRAAVASQLRQSFALKNYSGHGMLFASLTSILVQSHDVDLLDQLVNPPAADQVLQWFGDPFEMSLIEQLIDAAEPGDTWSVA